MSSDVDKPIYWKGRRGINHGDIYRGVTAFKAGYISYLRWVSMKQRNMESSAVIGNVVTLRRCQNKVA